MNKKIKWIFSILVIAALAISTLSGCSAALPFLQRTGGSDDTLTSDSDKKKDGDGEQAQNADLVKFREELVENEDIGGIAHLSYYDLSYDELIEKLAEEYKDDYSFIAKIKEDNYIDFSGDDYYVIVPASDDYKIKIYENTDINEYYMFEKGDEIYSGGGEPVIVHADASDLYANTVVEISDEDGKSYSFKPYQTGYNGNVSLERGKQDGYYMYEFTHNHSGNFEAHFKDVHKYDELALDYYAFIVDEEEADGTLGGDYAIETIVRMSSWQSTLSEIGFYIRDYSGDGVPEFVVGSVDGDNIVYALYTLKDGKPELIFESNGRQSYYYSGNDFIYLGSDSAMTSIRAKFSLTEDAQIDYFDYCFTYIFEGDTEVSVLSNTTGELDPDSSTLMAMNMEEFEELFEEEKTYYERWPFTPFITFDGQGLELYMGSD